MRSPTSVEKTVQRLQQLNGNNSSIILAIAAIICDNDRWDRAVPLWNTFTIVTIPPAGWGVGGVIHMNAKGMLVGRRKETNLGVAGALINP